MKILTIETSSKMCGVSILDNNTNIDTIELHTGLTHSESLMPIINDIFLNNNLELKNIDLIVCDIGPGSFTGIRIGVATAKAFSDSLNIHAIGVNSLEALAYNIKEKGYICSLIDAKNNNCYYSLYKLNNDNYAEIIEPMSSTIENMIETLLSYNENITFVGDGAVTYKEIISNSLQHSSFSYDNEIHSYNLGIVGLTHKNNTHPLLPLYLKKPQAERQLEEKLNSLKKDRE